MLIGIDLDNTIVCYDRVFSLLAAESGLPGDICAAGKTAIRDSLRQQGREDEWTVMQGKAYGSRMGEAQPFSGALEFFRLAGVRGCGLCIVSHRTKQPFLGEACDLHASAKDWLRKHGVDLAARVFLEETAAGKAERIGSLGCDVFIDDLPEFLGRPDFPARTRRLHFNPAGVRDSGALEVVTNWSEIGRLLLGP